jgi:hypothetical protein
MTADGSTAFTRCDGCGYWRPCEEIVLTFVHTAALRYCVACELVRAHHPDEVRVAGRPS